MLGRILPPAPNEKGDERGRPRDAGDIHNYLASMYCVAPETIANWIWKGRSDAKKYAKVP